jgi:PAS domain S-box-containing protein
VEPNPGESCAAHDFPKLHLMKEVVERMRDPVIITEAKIDLPGPRIVFVNQAFLDETGYSRDEVLGQTPRLLQGPLSSRETLDKVRQHLSRWEPVRVELLNYRKDHSTYWVELDIFPLVDPNDPRGWVTHWLSVQKNVDWRVRAAEELNKAVERYRLLSDHIHDVISAHTPDGICEYVSDSIERLAGYLPIESVGQTFHYFTHPDDLPILEEFHQELFNGRSAFEVEWRFRKKNNEFIWLRSQVVGEYTAAGELTRIIIGSRDITERKVFEQHLIQSQKLQAIGQLSNGIAHDFNNLLTVVIGCAELLMEGRAKNDPVFELAEDISRAGERGAALTRQLRAFSRQAPLHIETLDLNEIVRSAEVVFSRWELENVHFQSFRHPEPLMIRGDAVQLSQALLHLALNARDAMPTGGSLTIQTGNCRPNVNGPSPNPNDAHLGKVWVRVQDSGFGMSEAVQSRIFEPFFTTKPIGQGTGLGLSMVYGIVQSLKGEIDVSSQVGIGTTVTIYLPEVDDNHENVSLSRLAAPKTRRANARLLYIEDDPTVRRLTESMITEAGYAVQSTDSGLQALAIYDQEKEKPDLMLIDVSLPDVNGQQLAESIWQLNSNQKVLFVTGYSAAQLDKFGYDPKLYAVIPKPFDTQKLLRAIRKLLGSTAS